ncbi:hypothetical protein BKP37_17525 [Anaerobacillus alkalilacustris]|uniref:TIGR00375 family protein n=1 Tax=Anaerobacillus alkalilacustris TaxID=393763 RepID=A0A1S2LEE9_9BACI|nr:endonuclease Q family protein [Anaerobacillus alkalilacustris]OIJ10736.1 hypothetical protein BKP37_17525 [Anaerobacillus alkalilacustris]
MSHLKSFFVDLHIHLGATASGKPVKITASKSLTLERVLNEAVDIKGLDLIGIIDCHVPEVLAQIDCLLEKEILKENKQGGLCYKGKISFVLGSEIEVYDKKSKGPIHVLVYFPYLKTMKQFSEWFSIRVTNITLSSQRIYEEGVLLQEKVKELGGLFIPAHVFTPFKSLYGRGVERSLTEVFNPEWIDAIELGLSSDTTMANQIEELYKFTFLTNSDAHSLANIAREYQKIIMQQPSFYELEMAIKNLNGRKVECNFGLDPQLGKYYQTTCERCMEPVTNEMLQTCPGCGHRHFVKGVSARIKEIVEVNQSVKKLKKLRPPYIHQVPLQFIPGVGPKTLQKLRQRFKTDMNIIHDVSQEDLQQVVPMNIVDLIIKARMGELSLKQGGGGKYGKIK